MLEENILVIRRALLNQLGSFQGLNLDLDRYLPTFLDKQNNFFTARGPAETNPELKQLIPYAIFTFGNKILRYTRGGKSGEKRLAAKMSIGIGGHINDTDGSGGAFDSMTYLNAVNREISEELILGGAFTQRPVALLNDDSNDVGKVHLGVVHIVRLSSPEIASNESAIADIQLLDPAEIASESDRLETWSQICLGHLPDLLKIEMNAR
jgi:predicted NUDIX family phosphoesterase